MRQQYDTRLCAVLRHRTIAMRKGGKYPSLTPHLLSLLFRGLRCGARRSLLFALPRHCKPHRKQPEQQQQKGGVSLLPAPRCWPLFSSVSTHEYLSLV